MSNYTNVSAAETAAAAAEDAWFAAEVNLNAEMRAQARHLDIVPSYYFVMCRLPGNSVQALRVHKLL